VISISVDHFSSPTIFYTKGAPLCLRSASAMALSHSSISLTTTLTSISSKTQFVISPKTNPFSLDSSCFKLYKRSSFSVRAMGSSASSSQKPDNTQGPLFLYLIIPFPFGLYDSWFDEVSSSSFFSLFLVILFKRDDTRNLIILVYVLDIVLFHLFGALLISFFFDNWIIRKIIRGSMQFVCFFNEIYWILVLLFVLIDHDAVFLLLFFS